MRNVYIYGEFSHIDPADFQKRLQHYFPANVLTIPLKVIMDDLQNHVPWIDQIILRRIWPDKIVMVIIEKHLVARWNKRGWVTYSGVKPFFLDTDFMDSDSKKQIWPNLQGPKGTFLRVVNFYYRLNKLPFIKRDAIASLTLGRWQGWSIVLSSGLILHLGQDEYKSMFNLKRFSDNYDKIKSDTSLTLKAVDLRYPNGFALGWKTQSRILAR